MKSNNREPADTYTIARILTAAAADVQGARVRQRCVNPEDQRFDLA